MIDYLFDSNVVINHCSDQELLIQNLSIWQSSYLPITQEYAYRNSGWKKVIVNQANCFNPKPVKLGTIPYPCIRNKKIHLKFFRKKCRKKIIMGRNSSSAQASSGRASLFSHKPAMRWTRKRGSLILKILSSRTNHHQEFLLVWGKIEFTLHTRNARVNLYSVWTFGYLLVHPCIHSLFFSPIYLWKHWFIDKLMSDKENKWINWSINKSAN